MHVPPKAHLRKAQARIERVEAMGLHDLLRPEGEVKFPPKLDRRLYMEQYDLMMRDYKRLLADLLAEGEANDY